MNECDRERREIVEHVAKRERLAPTRRTVGRTGRVRLTPRYPAGDPVGAILDGLARRRARSSREDSESR